MSYATGSSWPAAATYRHENINNYAYIDVSNLTGDLFRTDFLHSVPIALSNAWQVLWSVNTLDGKWSIYLSTPIPEPGGAGAVAAGSLVLLLRRRRQDSSR